MDDKSNANYPGAVRVMVEREYEHPEHDDGDPLPFDLVVIERTYHGIKVKLVAAWNERPQRWLCSLRQGDAFLETSWTNGPDLWEHVSDMFRVHLGLFDKLGRSRKLPPRNQSAMDELHRGLAACPSPTGGNRHR